MLSLSDIEFTIDGSNYIGVMNQEYKMMYKKNLHCIIGITKKFDPLLINESIINGNKSLLEYS